MQNGIPVSAYLYIIIDALTCKQYFMLYLVEVELILTANTVCM